MAQLARWVMSFLEFIDVARSRAGGRQPDASWLSDPTARHELRYWDGERWTEWVSDGAEQATDALDLGQGGATWHDRYWNDAIERAREQVVASQVGASVPELRAISRCEFEAKKLLRGHSVEDVDVQRIEAALAIMHTPRETLTRDRDRAKQSTYLNALNAEMMAAGLAVGLVHCARCRAVVDVVYDESSVRYRCPAHHKFMLDDVSVVAPHEAERVRAELAVEPPRKGVRL